MSFFKWTRTQQMWLLMVVCFLLFSGLIALVPGMTLPLFWRVLAAGALTSILTASLFEFWLRRTLRHRERTAQLITRIATGDLAVGGADIARATRSQNTAAALRALVVNLERTIRRFGQLAADVSAVSESINSRARILGRSAAEQLFSTDSASASITQIDTSINTVRTNMEELSANAEETSTSVLQMSASIEEVSKIAETLAEFVEQTSTALEQMSASINEVATNTESFSSFATQTASSMVEMNITTEEIGKSARQSAELSRYVKDAASEGRIAVTGSVEGMRNIQVAVEEAKIALNELAERSDEIGEIVRVIDEIAGQTNLLALNAAIIAAQAGERGKGFAVVADEIRDLSERTSVSTDEIRTLISNVQNSVSRAAEQMTISSDRVADGVNLTARAELVLEKILDITARSTSSIAEIAKATAEQSRGSAAATRAIEEVTKMVQQTAAATQQQSQTARKVGEQASTVRDYTKHLKRAMKEQESGSRAISRAMENVMSLVQNVLESTSVLAAESGAIVKSMAVVQLASRDSNVSLGDLNQMSTTLSHESTLLKQELDRFTLPVPDAGGRAVTATVLWQQLTLDPIHIGAAALGFMSRMVHETLVSYGEGAELIPALAERWEVLEQGHVYRMHLRRNVKFHNGRTMEARDIHDSLVRLLLPDQKAGSAWIMKNVRGSADVMEGRTRTLSGIQARDAYTVDFILDEPLAFFLSLLTMNEVAIVPAEETRDAERFRTHAVGAGAFRVQEVVEGTHVHLVRNENFFIAGQPHLDELVFRLDLRSFRDVAEAFLRGEIDVAHGVPLSMVSEIRKDERLSPYLLQTVQLHSSYFAYDCSTAPFDRLEVRQAVAHAVDRDRINEKVFSGLSVVAKSLIPPGLMGYDPALEGNVYDPERSRALLRQAGQGGGFKVAYRTWDTDEFNNSGVLALVIEDLAAVGIEVQVTRHDAVEARRPLESRGHGMVFCGNWYADFPDPDNFFYVFFHGDTSSLRGIFYHRNEIDADIVEARRSNDVDRRTAIYRDLDRMVVREAPILPLFHERLFVLHKPHIRGVRTSLVPPPVRYTDVWVERQVADTD